MINIPNLNALKDWCIEKFPQKEDIPTKLSELENDSGYVTIETIGAISSVIDTINRVSI